MKNSLMKCARKLIYQTSFEEMQDILLDYQDFLMQDKNYKEPISCEKSILSCVCLFFPWMLLIFYTMFMYFVTRDNYTSYNLKLWIVSLSGIIITQLLFYLYIKKSLLLSRCQGDTRSHVFLVSISVLLGLTSILWVLTSEKIIRHEILEVVLILLLFWSLYNYLQSSHLYFYSLQSITISLVIFYQYSVLRSMLHFEDFQNNFKYIVIYLSIHLSVFMFDLIIVKKYKSELVLV